MLYFALERRFDHHGNQVHRNPSRSAMESNDASAFYRYADFGTGKLPAKETISFVRAPMRMALLVLALSAVTGLAACKVSLGSVNLDTIENPRGWDPGSSDGRPDDR